MVIDKIKEYFNNKKVEKEPIEIVQIVEQQQNANQSCLEDVFVSSEGLDHPPPRPIEDELPDMKLSSRESEYLRVNCVQIDSYVQ